MKNTFLILSFAFAVSTSAQNVVQTWAQRYNGSANQYDYPTAIAIDTNGTVFVTGYSQGLYGASIPPRYFYDFDFATVAYSNTGLPLWTNRYGGASADEVPVAIGTDGSGRLFVAGYSAPTNNVSHAVVVAYSSAGLPLWTNRVVSPNETRATALGVDTNGDVVVTGYIGYSNYFTIKYSGAGVPLWTNFYNGTGMGGNQPTAIAVDGGGNVYVTGNSGSSNKLDFATVGYSSAGMSLWTNRYNGIGNDDDVPRGIAVDGEGSVFVFGQTISGVGFPGYDTATIKYSNSGVPLWTNRYDGPDYVSACAIGVDKSGDAYVASLGSGGRYVTIKYSGAGVSLWTNYYALGPYAYMRGLVVDKDNSVIVTGVTTSTGGDNYHWATVAYSSTGAALWTNRYDPSQGGQDEPAAIAADLNGNVFVTGYSLGSGSFADYATIKYSAVQQPIPLLIQALNGQSGGNQSVVLSWTNTAFNLQTAPSLSDTFTNLPGASSPYTNSLLSGRQFFRLILN